MPWCPNCRNEYRIGITTCAECKIALVDSLNDIIDKLDQTDPLPEDTDELEVLDEVKASSVESCPNLGRSKLGIYDSYETAYKEHRSSAYLFLGFSVLVFIYILLNAFHVIQFISGVFSYCIISALCLGLVFLGLSSLKKVKELSEHLDGEQQLTKKINEFLNDLGGFSKLDEPDWSELSEDVIYFKRTARIRQLLTAEFGELEENYLDKVIEDYYDSQCD